MFVVSGTGCIFPPALSFTTYPGLNVDSCSVWNSKTNQNKFIKYHSAQIFLYLQLFTLFLNTWKILLWAIIHKRYYYFVKFLDFRIHRVYGRHKLDHWSLLTKAWLYKTSLFLKIHWIMIWGGGGVRAKIKSNVIYKWAS